MVEVDSQSDVACQCGEENPVGLRKCQGDGCDHFGCEACDLVDFVDTSGGRLEGLWLCDACHLKLVNLPEK